MIPVADLIEEGVVTGIQSSGVRGRIGEAISHGKLKNPAIIRSHGGRSAGPLRREMFTSISPLSVRQLPMSMVTQERSAARVIAEFFRILWWMQNMQTM